MKTVRVAALGECMIELSETDDPAHLRRGVAGDTFNTTVYLARCLAGTGADVAYVTALGTDPLSGEMLAAWAQEGLNVERVRRLERRLPGLYWIRLDERGERSFLYWRTHSAARFMLEGAGGEALLRGLEEDDLVYLSGITLAILPEADRARLLDHLGRLKALGRRIAFDPNYRARLWPSEDTARRAVTAACKAATIVLPTFDDEALLFEDDAPETTLKRLRSLGVPEIALKNGPKPGLFTDGRETCTALPIVVARPADTTGAGDSFNGAYLAARLKGLPIAEAADAANRLAARVVMHKGAIIPRSAMPPV